MKPLIVLITSFAAAFIVYYLYLYISGAAAGSLFLSFKTAGSIAMAVMLLFTAMGHFLFTDGMIMMLPAWMPFKRELVWLTGVFEVMAAFCLFLPQHRDSASLALILFFILMLPANIYAAYHRVDYQKATNEGPGRDYLWFRIPLQVLFIVWVWYFGLFL